MHAGFNFSQGERVTRVLGWRGREDPQFKDFESHPFLKILGGQSLVKFPGSNFYFTGRYINGDTVNAN